MIIFIIIILICTIILVGFGYGYGYGYGYAYAYLQKAPAIKGIVTKIIDGDTIDAKLANNETVRIRLSLANTPERGEPGWRQATEFTKAKCPIGSKITMDPDAGQAKSYKRNVAKVFCNTLLINRALVNNGYAEINETRYCQITEFKAEKWTGCTKK